MAEGPYARRAAAVLSTMTRPIRWEGTQGRAFAGFVAVAAGLVLGWGAAGRVAALAAMAVVLAAANGYSKAYSP
jgi:hypothetical protein